MTGIAIVAIPRDGDPVWKYSSEKIPHMTLLFLGEQTDNDALIRITDYLDHIASMVMYPFYMTVDRRGTLGPDNADVLFFDKDKHGRAMINQVRDYLLEDTDIFTMYSSVDQYPEWTPHLTMGYPETPAKTDDRNYSDFYGVEFDRIAIWTGDYEGATFVLKGRDFEGVDMMMSDDVDSFLEHFGVKGMHWGVHRERTPVNTSTETVSVSGKAKKATPFTKASRYQKKNADTAVTVTHRPGQKLTTKGGSNRPAHPDAVNVAVSKRIAKSSSTDALSTKELQDMVSRMNLEQQYNKLTNPQNPTGKSMLQKGKEAAGNLVGIKTSADAFIADPYINSEVSKQATEAGYHRVAKYVNSKKPAAKK